jgi:ABC-type sugar transport system ATPase subunit
MIGRPLETAFPERAPVPAASPVLLKAVGLTRGHRLGPVSFEVRAGEILGFAGLEGSGVDEVFRILFGLEEPSGGTIIYRDTERRIKSPVDAIRQGFGMVPANRREQGLMMEWSVSKNTTLVILDRLLDRLKLLDTTRERETSKEYVRKLDIATDSIDKRVVNLSGGNQQKVVVAKWLASGPKILILNDPTRGVDVGAKSEIYSLCNQLARQGLALLFTSSEVGEITGLCDRTLAFYKGQVLREFTGRAATKSAIMQVIAGGMSETVPMAPATEPESAA